MESTPSLFTESFYTKTFCLKVSLKFWFRKKKYFKFATLYAGVAQW